MRIIVLDEVLPKLKAYTVADAVSNVTCCKEKTCPSEGDGTKGSSYGLSARKKNIAKSLNERGCEVTSLSGRYNGRRDHCFRIRTVLCCQTAPAIRRTCGPIIEETQEALCNTDIPIFAICLGHQLMALANGAETKKDEMGAPRRQPSGQGSDQQAGCTCLHRTMVMQLTVRQLTRK